ncbi:MAG: hypothetical protein FWC50_02450 [Planctomycetaceae bacterium]|nr:hypothetical protein [Planctomycetaceae bacterium]
MKKVILFILLVFLLMPSVFAQSKKESGIPDWETFKKENPDIEKFELANGANADNNLFLEMMKYNHDHVSDRFDFHKERLWTEKKTGKSIKARYVGKIDETVVVKRSLDQKIVAIPLVDLDDISKAFCGKISIIRTPQTDADRLITVCYLIMRIEDDDFPKSWIYERDEKNIENTEAINNTELKKEALLEDWQKLTYNEKYRIANEISLAMLCAFGYERSNLTNNYEDEFFIESMSRMMVLMTNHIYHICMESPSLKPLAKKIKVYGFMLSIMLYSTKNIQPENFQRKFVKFDEDIDFFDPNFLSTGLAIQETLSEMPEKSK